MQNFEGGLVMQ